MTLLVITSFILISASAVLYLSHAWDIATFLGVAAVLLGAISLRLGWDSDTKMKAVAEYLFIEKIAVLNEHALEISKLIHQNYRDQFLADIDAALAVKNWASKAHKNELAKLISQIKSNAEAELNSLHKRNAPQADIGALHTFVNSLNERINKRRRL